VSLVHLLWRLVIAVFGYCMAAIAAGIFLLVAMGIASPEGFFGGSQFYQMEGWILVVAAAAVVSVTAFAPAIIAILIAEVFAVRSWIYCTIVGIVIATFVVYSGPYFAYGAAAEPVTDIVLASACGAVGGLVYWLIAGRNAGFAKPTA
jgi:hypothetical protein